MKLKCDLIIQNVNSQSSSTSLKSGEKALKSVTIGIYRPTIDENDDKIDKTKIILTIDSNCINLKYYLKKLETHTKFINEGKATLKLVDENIYLLLSNATALSLINFISFIKVKLAKIDTSLENGKLKPKYSKSLLLNSFVGISPLCEKEVNEVISKSKKQASATAAYNNSPVRFISNANKVKKCPNSLVHLTDEQNLVISSIKEGNNVFFTGSGGTGKSFLINLIKQMLPSENCFITASTGSAASLIGGITLHAFAGLACNNNVDEGGINFDRVVERIINSKDKLLNWKKCSHLIIDEISMIDSKTFELLDYIARSIKSNDLPFGGIQLILSGDFFQLPPVSKSNEPLKKFCFQSRLWSKSINTTIQLTEVKRQDDMTFIKMLEEIRYGKCSVETIDLLEKSKNKTFTNKILPTKLCTHKDDVNLINTKELDSIKELKYTYKSIDSCDAYKLSMLNTLCPATPELTLKLNAQVMLVKNLNVNSTLVNGTRGCVVGFTENKLPIVKFLNGTELTIKYETWSFNMGPSYKNQVFSRKQLPLQLAWAISIHKSQGMTLDCIELSLSRAFEYGQAYVALSRAKSLENLNIIDFDISAIQANPIVVKFYQELTFLNKKQKLAFD